MNFSLTQQTLLDCAPPKESWSSPSTPQRHHYYYQSKMHVKAFLFSCLANVQKWTQHPFTSTYRVLLPISNQFTIYYRIITAVTSNSSFRCLFTDDSIHPYKIVDLFYIDYFRKSLVFNVYKNGEWGSYRHLPLEEETLVECEHAFIGPTEIGNFASLSYIESRIPQLKYVSSASAEHVQLLTHYSLVFQFLAIFSQFNELRRQHFMPRILRQRVPPQGRVQGRRVVAPRRWQR